MHVDIRLNGKKSKIHYQLGNQPLKKKRLFNNACVTGTVAINQEYLNQIVASWSPESFYSISGVTNAR